MPQVNQHLRSPSLTVSPCVALCSLWRLTSPHLSFAELPLDMSAVWHASRPPSHLGIRAPAPRPPFPSAKSPSMSMPLDSSTGQHIRPVALLPQQSCIPRTAPATSASGAASTGRTHVLLQALRDRREKASGSIQAPCPPPQPGTTAAVRVDPGQCPAHDELPGRPVRRFAFST